MLISPSTKAKQARKVHGREYGYSLLKAGTAVKDKIICSKHGVFVLLWYNHLYGRKCPKCTQENRKSIAMSVLQKISRARRIHGKRFDYCKVTIGVRGKDNIRCIEHNLEFSQEWTDHLRSKGGCPRCTSNLISRSRKHSLKEMLGVALKVHGDEYDYSKVSISTKDKSIIKCREHGEFVQRWSAHVDGQGCPKCRIQKLRKPRISIEKKIVKAELVHGKQYDYSKVEDRSTGFDIIGCRIHGEFRQRWSSHINGCGCLKCGHLKISKARLSWFAENPDIKTGGGGRSKWVDYTWGNEVISLQGYEPQALDFLRKSERVRRKDIAIRSSEGKPTVPYKLGKSERIYIPDFYLKSTNTIIEVKSFYTWRLHLDRNKAKLNTCRNKHNVRLIIMGEKAEVLSDITMLRRKR